MTKDFHILVKDESNHNKIIHETIIIKETLDQVKKSKFDITNLERKLFDAAEKVNYISTHKTYAKDYIKVLNNKLDTNIIFKALNSPKFYNYSTDKIEVEITKKDALKLFQYVRNEELKQEVFNIIKESSTSKDGYIAFHNYEDFFKKDNLNIFEKNY
jgi:hypothetical protein